MADWGEVGTPHICRQKCCECDNSVRVKVTHGRSGLFLIPKGKSYRQEVSFVHSNKGLGRRMKLLKAERYFETYVRGEVIPRATFASSPFCLNFPTIRAVPKGSQ